MFKDVSESYPTDGDIVIRYVNKSGQAESGDDSIGLFLIGWKKVSEAVATLRARDHVIEEGTGDKKLVMSSTLFCDKITDGQFYQLCYISYASKEDKNDHSSKQEKNDHSSKQEKNDHSSKQDKKGSDRKGTEAVIGASCAFCIRRASSDDMVMVPSRLTPTDGEGGSSDTTDDEEFIVVKSEQALIQERLQSLVTNNGLLEFQCKSLAQRLQCVEEELSRVRAEKVRIEGQMKTGHETVQHVTHLLSEVRRKESAHEAVLAQLTQENQRLGRENQRLGRENQSLTVELKRVASLKQMEIEGLRQECITGSKKEEQIKAEHDETMTLVATLLDEKEQWMEEKEQWMKEKEHIVKVQADLQSMVDALRDESMKLASEKEQVSNSLRQVSEEIAQKKEEIAQKDEEIASMRDELVRKDSEMRELEEKRKRLSDQVDHLKGVEGELLKCRSLNSDLEGMIKVLQSDLSQAELKVESQAKSSASVRAVSLDQETMIDDLTRRLKKAAEEYVELKRSKVKTEAKYEKLKSKVDVSN